MRGGETVLDHPVRTTSILLGELGSARVDLDFAGIFLDSTGIEADSCPHKINALDKLSTGL